MLAAAIALAVDLGFGHNVSALPVLELTWTMGLSVADETRWVSTLASRRICRRLRLGLGERLHLGPGSKRESPAANVR